jgi:pathogenesis-related protein 1
MYSQISIIITVILVTAAILTVQSSMLQVSHAQLDATSQNTILTMHNQERAAVGVAPLTWSTELANNAQNWARNIASLGLGPGAPAPHAPWDQRNGQGENLAWGTKGAFPVATFVQGWASEKSNYVPGTPIEQTLGSPNGVYGHYTQMVWSSTTQIGCGLASDANQDYLVCRYAPTGNWIGQVPYGAGAAAVAEEETTLGAPPSDQAQAPEQEFMEPPATDNQAQAPEQQFTD